MTRPTPADTSPEKPARRLRVTGFQMHAAPDPRRNLQRIRKRLPECADSADLVILPECALCLGSATSIRAAARPADEWCTLLSGLLAEALPRPGPFVIFGGVPVRRHDQRIVNRCFVFDQHGRPAAAYDKMHLFRMRTADGRGPDESRVYTPGKTPVAIDVRGWHVALSICYDLRFPEYYRALAPFDLLLCPAAFTRLTGRAHWITLLRARAIENLAYAAGVNQWGRDEETGVELYGNSAIVSPWGRVLRRASHSGDAVLTCELRRDAIVEARRRLPALEHRTLACAPPAPSTTGFPPAEA